MAAPCLNLQILQLASGIFNGGNSGKQEMLVRTYVADSRRCFKKIRAAPSDSNPKPNPKSVICTNCDGNGAVLCSQCKGSGVNSVDFFNGQFKVGDSCWLCGGKNDVLCGDCNGAGFVGGFLSTYDE
ncbi:protein BUNDLE SHEATH DEFECTIVE 2, chloroplastic-like [Mercurialis annua]|uniref:protein BUNDLE SHEATH DEFECTIVE 2, chloroplastic-like n=1 Tax=Mercurialis annua TaxID=3986 RepID=UPI00215FC350|nr:protein BUNDLE SHEATH DEFECTIVE 2, chloroplastic-like [Mercurialis annua]